MTDALTVGSLFSGIGGFDLGLERAGLRILWQCESNPFCREVLAKHWPAVPCYQDARELPSDVARVDLICGGYPCQPFSAAGLRGGTADDRYLWPAFARAIRVLRPRYALMENVAGHLSLGFDRTLADLAALGYDTEWTCIPAAAVGAPHIRNRVFVMAHANGRRLPRVDVDARDGREVPRERFVRLFRGSDERAHVADANGKRRDGRPGIQEAARQTGCDALERNNPWSVEPDVGRMAHGVPSRVDRLRALGNAVVPQVAELIGRRLIEVTT